jgi:hypothetical protein
VVKQYVGGLESNSVVKHMPSKFQVLHFVPSATKKKTDKKKKKRREYVVTKENVILN